MSEIEWDIRDKMVLITGATSGIGAVMAGELARRGARVILSGRDPKRCAATAGRIQQETHGPPVDFIAADLASQAEVRRLAQEIQLRTDRLDVLLNNAGGLFMKRQESADGIEMTWALNHMAYFLLTNLLLERLKTSAPARVVNVSSNAHIGGRIQFEDLEGRRSYRGYRAYAQSKLANILFTYELARRLEGTRVTANALHPGFVATRFGWNNRGIVGLGSRLSQRLFAVSPSEGARTGVYLAASPQVSGVSGEYFIRERSVRSAPQTYDRASAERLWQVSEAMSAANFRKP